jgi:hypothetical protein
MRKIIVTLAASAAILFAGSFAWQADAQITRGAFTVPTQSKNFTPIEKAACGPHRGRWCGPWHHRVCTPYRCWCAPC